MKKRYLFVIGLFIIAQQLSAQSKLPVKVITRVTEKEYKDYFLTDELQKLNTGVSQTIRDLLNDFLPIFSFITSGPAADSIVFSLDRRYGDESETLFSVDVHVLLKGANIMPCNPYTIPFAENGDYSMYFGDWEFLQDEMTQKIRELGRDVFKKELIENLFEHVNITPIINNIDFTRKLWTLPYTYYDLSLNIGSRFLIAADYAESGIHVRRSYMSEAKGTSGPGFPYSNIITEALKQSEQKDPLSLHRSNTFSKLLGIYLISYVPIEPQFRDVTFN